MLIIVIVMIGVLTLASQGSMPTPFVHTSFSGFAFQPLHELLLPPPAAAAATVLFLLGTWSLSLTLARRLWKDDSTPVDEAAVFFIVSAALASLSHALALAGIALVPLLRALGIPILLLGLLRLWKVKSILSNLLPDRLRDSSSRWMKVVAEESALRSSLGPCVGAMAGQPIQSYVATRNPFNRLDSSALVLFELFTRSTACRAVLDVSRQ